MTEFYKLVLPSGQFLDGKALAGVSINYRYPVKYIVGEWATPPIEGSKLFVFDSIENARNFIEYENGDYHLYKCEIKGEPITPEFMPLTYDLILLYWDRVKQNGDYGKSFDSMTPPPPGTLFVDSVKLLERVTQ